ncbi:GMC-OxRdtase-N domain-containing protein [Mycena venus]|uniref:GMC-OxRdtase-N domain-containing protein n=1 Tax=Mycena venus TaxID=2733690 RepID=A0A8H6Y840_9AGAR|nr:GMC-OxRdtase-N domain-containing protein [Mycena venus]
MHSSTLSFLFALALTLSATASPVVYARDGDLTFGEGNVARDVMNDLEARQRRKGRKGGFGFGGRKGGQKGGAGKGQAGKGQAGNGGAAAGAAPPATTTAAATGGKGGAATAGNGAAAAPAAATTDDGQNPPVTGQSPADISKNNFANLCALGFPKVPLTNGLQITTGSCNPIPIGNIPSVDNMPSSKFQNPKNLDTIASNTTFTVVLATTGIQLGTFTNAQKTYFGNPQKLNAKGQIIGHTHIVMEAVDSLTTTKLTNPKNFFFFKGVNTAQDGQGNVQVDVTGGVAPGVYRMCTIVSSATHQPAIVPVAQHGSLDDCVAPLRAAGAAGAAAATGNGKGAAAATGKGAQAATGKGAQAAQPAKAQPATAQPAKAQPAKAQAAPAKAQPAKAQALLKPSPLRLRQPLLRPSPLRPKLPPQRLSPLRLRPHPRRDRASRVNERLRCSDNDPEIH